MGGGSGSIVLLQAPEALELVAAADDVVGFDVEVAAGLWAAVDLGEAVDLGTVVDFAVATDCPDRFGPADVVATVEGLEARSDPITMPTSTPPATTNHSRRHQGFLVDTTGCIACGSWPG